MTASKRSPCASSASASRLFAARFHGHAPLLAALGDDAPIGGVVFDDQQALAGELRLRALPAGGGGGGGRSGQDGEMEGGAFAGIALDPDLAAHQLGQAFADGQAQPGAAVVASGGGIHLLERFEEAVLPVQRDADAGVAHGEMEQPLFRVAEKSVSCSWPNGMLRAPCAGGGDFDDDFALVGELHGVADQIDQDLPQPGHVADQDLGNGVVHQAGEVEVLLGGLGRQQIQGLLDAGVEFEGMVFQFEFAGFDLGEVEDVVDDGQQGVGAAAGGLDVIALFVRQIGVQQQRRSCR